MGQLQDFRKMATSLYDAFSDFRETVSIFGTVNSASTYNPSTGTTTKPSVASIGSGQCFRKEYKTEEIQGLVQPGDFMIVAKYDTLNADIEPNSIGQINGSQFDILRAEPKPKSNPIVVNMHCRNRSGS